MRGLGLDGPAGTGPMAPARDTTGGDHLVGIGGYIVIEALLWRRLTTVLLRTVLAVLGAVLLLYDFRSEIVGRRRRVGADRRLGQRPRGLAAVVSPWYQLVQYFDSA